MKAVEVYEPGCSRITEVGIPEPGINDVLIRVRACGLCGSEYLTWKLAENAPLSLGHEVSGEVVNTGAGVTGFRRGDRVTGLFRKGFAEYAVAPSQMVYKFPEELDFNLAALGEPVSCVVSGALRTEVGLGKTVAVIGSGFMGLMMLQLLKLKGAFHLIAIDTRADREGLARRFGADEFLTPEKLPPEYLLLESGGTGGVDVVAECTGNEQALGLAVTMLGKHSILSVVGFHQGGSRNVDFQMLNWKAADIVNAHEKRIGFKMQCMETGLKLSAKGKLDLNRLLTHHYNLEHLDQAFRDFAGKPDGYIKGVVTI